MDSEPHPGKPHITYPCPWTYAIIGWDEEDLLLAIGEVVKGRVHKVQFSRKSPKGQYCSVHLELTVDSEDDRNEIFKTLKKNPKIRMVL